VGSQLLTTRLVALLTNLPTLSYNSAATGKSLPELAANETAVFMAKLMSIKICLSLQLK
jgi:hypothetical protein